MKVVMMKNCESDGYGNDDDSHDVVMMSTLKQVNCPNRTVDLQ